MAESRLNPVYGTQPIQGSIPPGAPNAARNQRTSALIDQVSPGRTAPFSSLLIPAPSAATVAAASGGGANQTAYYTIKRWVVGRDVPEGAFLGCRVDSLSPYVYIEDLAEPNQFKPMGSIRRLGIFGYDPEPANTLVPYATQFSTCAGLLIATGERWRDKLGNTGQWTFGPLEYGFMGANAPQTPNYAGVDHSYVFRPPLGDIGDASGAAVQRMERTLRDTPFGARLVAGESIWVAFMTRFGSAFLGSNVTNGVFPVIANGEIFVTPSIDDRQLNQS